MRHEQVDENSAQAGQHAEAAGELADSWWYRVYAAVIITTLIVISSLWGFSRHFSH